MLYIFIQLFSSYQNIKKIKKNKEHIKKMRKKSTYCGIIQIRVVLCSWVNKFLQVRGDVISWVRYAMSPGKRTLIYKLRKELSFFYFYYVYFDASGNCGEVKLFKGLSSVLDCKKKMIAIKKIVGD